MRLVRLPSEDAGFTLVELVAVVTLTLSLGAIVAPRVNAFLRFQKATTAARAVEREMQTSRLKAVSASRALRVRFNCPTVGQMRVLELTGVAATDDAANRCSPTAYPSPGPRDALRSTPSLDSPVVYLPTGTTVTGAFLHYEFSPQGVAYTVSTTGTVTPVSGDSTVTVTRAGVSRTVMINDLGRVRLN